MSDVSRRTVLAGAAGLIGSALSFKAYAQAIFDPNEIYQAVTTEPFPIPAIDIKRLNPKFLRTVVPFESAEAPGTLIVDPEQRLLYVVNGDGRAIRYGVGVGRQGFAWSGVARIGAKREWPDWYPPKEMFERDPSIKAVMSNLQGGLGMHGGLGNPLGARAMYLFQGSRDTLYRIHGTLEPYSIGTRVSSGCIRMINQDVLDLYSRMPVDTKVMVLSPNGVAEPQVAEQMDTAEPVSTRRSGTRHHAVPAADQDPYADPNAGLYQYAPDANPN